MIEKVNRDWKHFLIFDTVEESGAKLRLGNQGIGFVNSNFTAKIDAILSFPEFYKPGVSAVVKINRQAVKDHAKSWRIIIIECCIAKGSLWRINNGRKDILTRDIRVTKGLYQIGDTLVFFFTGHRTDSLTYLFLTVMMEK